MIKWFRRGRFQAVFAVLWVSLAACSSLPAQATPIPSPTPDCYLQPQPTGEKIIRPTIEVAPPGLAHPGQVLQLRFSGGYVAMNNARVCGGEIVGYIHDDELPTPRVTRKFMLSLNDISLASGDICPPECEISFTIPSEVLPGKYQLSLWTPWGEPTVFDIEIVGVGTATP